MIKSISDTMICDCIDLMRKSVEATKPIIHTNGNERAWIYHLMEHVEKHNAQDVRYLAIADIDPKTNKMKGFMLCSTYSNFYNGELIMDVKDCIVDPSISNTAFIVIRLFDTMIDHVKKNKGSIWRADSVRTNSESILYTNLLKKRYNAVPFAGVYGTVNNGDNSCHHGVEN